MTRDHLMRIAGLKGAARIDEVLPALEGLYEYVRELEIKNDILVTANRTMAEVAKNEKSAIAEASQWREEARRSHLLRTEFADRAAVAEERINVIEEQHAAMVAALLRERNAANERAEKAEAETRAIRISSFCEYCGRRDVPALTEDQARAHLKACTQSPLIEIRRSVADALRCMNPSPASRLILETLLREELGN